MGKFPIVCTTIRVIKDYRHVDEDLELIFSRFGKILSCEVIRDKRTGDSLQYAFIEFENQKDCEQAYFKMQGVLIDDHRIHVDFSQSVSATKSLAPDRVRAKRGSRYRNCRIAGEQLPIPSAHGRVEVSVASPAWKRSGNTKRPKAKAYLRVDMTWSLMSMTCIGDAHNSTRTTSRSPDGGRGAGAEVGVLEGSIEAMRSGNMTRELMTGEDETGAMNVTGVMAITMLTGIGDDKWTSFTPSFRSFKASQFSEGSHVYTYK